MCQNTSVKVADGKYEVVLDDQGHMRFYRYGESWTAADKAFCYSNIIRALALELHEAREKIYDLEQELRE